MADPKTPPNVPLHEGDHNVGGKAPVRDGEGNKQPLKPVPPPAQPKPR